MKRHGGKTFPQPHLHPDPEDLGWLDATGPVLADNVLYVAYQTAREGWQIAVFEQTAPVSRIVPAVDRLSVERQLARVRDGLPLQHRDEERELRETLLDIDVPNPDPMSADGR